MTLHTISQAEKLLAWQEWCDCDKRRKELARPILAREIELKLSFIDWLSIPIIDITGTHVTLP